jgi:hypothetical protein
MHPVWPNTPSRRYASTGAVGIITAATVIAGFTGTVSKVYDGTDTATLTSANYTLAGMLGSDTAGLNYPTAGLYGSSQAGTGLMVTANGLSLSAANAGDYRLVSGTVAAPIGTILPAPTPATTTGSSTTSTPTPTTAVVDVAIVQVVGQLSGTTGVVPFTTKPAPPLWTITGNPPSGQNGPTGGVVVDP